MAFIANATTVFSFAEYQDVVDRDQRLFEANEGLDQTVVEDLLVRGTERILSELRSTSWWAQYWITRDNTTTITSLADVPALDATKIRARQNDFTDLCVYYTMYEYILPKIADFGVDNNAERNKIGYYTQKYDKLFAELIRSGDWYDFDDDETIQSDEKSIGVVNLRRVR